MHTDTVSIADFVKANRITMSTERVGDNPNMDDNANMDHWKVVMQRTGKRMTTYFSMGYGHNGKAPEAEDVLDCLASDASSYDNASSFEDWANDFGYDVDSRKAEKTFQAVQHSSKRLRNFLGDDLFDQLLYNTERQ